MLSVALGCFKSHYSLLKNTTNLPISCYHSKQVRNILQNIIFLFQ